MKRVLIVSYDLSQPGRNYEQVVKLIKAEGSWARIGGSAYLVYTEAAPKDVRDRVKQALDGNDKLYVGVSPAPSAWSGLPEDVAKWIHANQK